jgi:hypothetical protein
VQLAGDRSARLALHFSARAAARPTLKMRALRACRICAEAQPGGFYEVYFASGNKHVS